MEGTLDGKTFQRAIECDGTFGQPKGTRYHRITFANGMMQDNSNTFFGNPPSISTYKVQNGAILVQEEEGEFIQEYIINGTTICGNAGAVLQQVE